MFLNRRRHELTERYINKSRELTTITEPISQQPVYDNLDVTSIGNLIVHCGGRWKVYLPFHLIIQIIFAPTSFQISIASSTINIILEQFLIKNSKRFNKS